MASTFEIQKDILKTVHADFTEQYKQIFGYVESFEKYSDFIKEYTDFRYFFLFFLYTKDLLDVNWIPDYSILCKVDKIFKIKLV